MTHLAYSASYMNHACGNTDRAEDFSFIIAAVNCPKCLDVEWSNRTREWRHRILKFLQWWRLWPMLRAFDIALKKKARARAKIESDSRRGKA